DILQDSAERTKFLLPIADRPRGTVEMADRVRGDLMAVAVKSVRVFDAFANLLGRAAKADAGIAPPLMRAFIDVPAAVGDEIASADEEGEVKPVAVPVQLGSKVGELLPALELGAIVERHDDEVRRSTGAPPRQL